MKIEIPEQLVAVVNAGIEVNRAVPGSIAVGGSICSLFTRHRESVDIDFVLSDLSQHFKEVRETLFDLPGWKEARIRVPVLILGSLNGIDVEFRQLRRSMPLETQTIETPNGKLVVPTIEELLRIKAFLAYERNSTRDFVDFAELSLLFDIGTIVEILRDLDERFRWEKQPSIIVEVTKKLMLPMPYDLDDGRSGFEHLRFTEPKLKSWAEVAERCKVIGNALAVRVLTEQTNETSTPEN